MAEYLPPVVAQLTGDIGDFLTKLAEAEAALSSLEGKSIGVNFDTSVTQAVTELTDLGSEVDSVRSKLLSIEDLQPWDSINTNAARTQLALLDAQLAQIKAESVIDLVLNFEDGSGTAGNAESIGQAVGQEYMTGLYRRIFSSPDWVLIGNIARDALGNQLELGPVSEVVANDYMTGLYRQIQSSPDWVLIDNIARDKLGNQLALPAAGETGEGSGGDSGGGGGGGGGLSGLLGGLGGGRGRRVPQHPQHRSGSCRDPGSSRRSSCRLRQRLELRRRGRIVSDVCTSDLC